MSDFGSYLRKKRQSKKLTLEELSMVCHLDKSQLSRWETGRTIPTVMHRLLLLDIADILGMDDSEKNDLLIKAGLSPLEPSEFDIDAILSTLGPRRNKSYFLRRRMGWSERQTADKLSITFFDVRRDVEEVEMEQTESKTYKGQGEGVLRWQQMQHIRQLQELAGSVERNFIEYPDLPSHVLSVHLPCPMLQCNVLPFLALSVRVGTAS